MLTLASFARTLSAITLTGAALSATAAAPDAAVERGRYLVRIGGCNDCHTPGFAPSGGNVPESDWLIGDGLGYSGPWGTTYGSNLRQYFAQLTEAQWLQAGRNLAARPPMPVPSIRAMTDDDLRAVYRYVRSLPPSDHKTPAYRPPGVVPPPPAVVFPSGQ